MSDGMARWARVVWVVWVVGAGGCIEYFAEPPDLGSIPEVDGTVDAGDAGPDVCKPAVETCDGADNDCDGITDEGPGAALCPRLESNGDTAAVVCRDAGCVLSCYAGRHDIDGVYESGCEYGPCSPFDPPGEATEECNGRDDDCDGRTDEGAGLMPPLADEQRGICSGVGQVCTGTDWREPRSGEIEGYEADETRCDGLDNDCDGSIDEAAGLMPPLADEQRGVCVGRVKSCMGGDWREPGRGGVAGYEVDETRCDGLDNDCDGSVDEAAGLVPPLADEQRGVCAGRVKSCTDADWREPGRGEVAGYEADETRCDGLDNDCDGGIDEGIAGCDVVRCGTERAGAAGAPPCNGCPDGTVVPAGWVCIPPGGFTMGSPPGEVGRFASEGPQWPVELTRPLLMQATEVTQGEWRALMGNNPSGFQPCDLDEPAAADVCPVEGVNWWEAVEYANRASLRDGLLPCYEPPTGCVGEPGEGMECDDEVEWVRDCEGYRLPTEAEWEYAARASTVGRWSSGAAEAALAAAAWYSANSGDHSHPVGRLGANAWGLFDVHGNVYEWVWDWYGSYPAEPPAVPVADPAGPPIGDDRVFRGGSWGVDARNVRSAVRGRVRPGNRVRVLGFRPVRLAPRGP